MKNLLVPVDFSDATERIVSVATELALLFQAKVWLLHCASEEPGFGEIPTFVALPDEALPGRFPDEYRKLAALTASLRTMGVDAELNFVGGSPATKILSAAKDHHADLIIMASHGHGTVRELLMGSVTTDVLRGTDSPLLVIPFRNPQP